MYQEYIATTMTFPPWRRFTSLLSKDDRGSLLSSVEKVQIAPYLFDFRPDEVKIYLEAVIFVSDSKKNWLTNTIFHQRF